MTANLARGPSDGVIGLGRFTSKYSDFEGGRAGLCTFLSLLLICGQLIHAWVGRTCQAMASVQLGTYVHTYGEEFHLTSVPGPAHPTRTHPPSPAK